jgi:branched-subunit amino acid transport protein
VTIVESTASSGAVLGVVVVLLLQQLGLLALSDLWTSVLSFVVAIALGAIIFGAAGSYVEHRR